MSMAVSFERVGFDEGGDRTLLLLSAEEPADLSGVSIVTGSKYFVSLIAWDSRNESAAEVARLARMLLDAGCVYFCCWGPGCERLHDIIDEEYARDGMSVHDDESTIMTTWHDDESLEESAWYSVNVAFPDDRFFDQCTSVVAVCIGSHSWSAEIARAFEDPRSLVSRIVDGDNNAA